ncbi:MAG: hypothetical protein V1745_03430 [Patescibacteria group bacterium]
MAKPSNPNDRSSNRLKEIEAELKAIQRRFQGIKKRSQTAISSAISKQDAKAIEDIRKKMGLK